MSQVPYRLRYAARHSTRSNVFLLTLWHSELPKLYGVLAVLNAIGLREVYLLERLLDPGKCAGSHKSCPPL